MLKRTNTTSLLSFSVSPSSSAEFQMRGPGLTTVLNGKNKTLYMQKPAALEEATRKNLDLSLKGAPRAHRPRRPSQGARSGCDVRSPPSFPSPLQSWAWWTARFSTSQTPRRQCRCASSLRTAPRRSSRLPVFCDDGCQAACCLLLNFEAQHHKARGADLPLLGLPPLQPTLGRHNMIINEPCLLFAGTAVEREGRGGERERERERERDGLVTRPSSAAPLPFLPCAAHVCICKCMCVCVCMCVNACMHVAPSEGVACSGLQCPRPRSGSKQTDGLLSYLLHLLPESSSQLRTRYALVQCASAACLC